EDRPLPVLEAVACEEVAVVASGQEAGLLALGPRGRSKTRSARLGARLLLALLAEREPEARKEAWIETGKHVGLVLGGIGTAGEKEAAAWLRDAGVVTRCEPRGADPVGEREQGGEPEAAVAADAGVGRLAARIALDERVDDSLAKRLAPAQCDGGG